MPDAAEPVACSTFVHGGFAKTRDSLIVECTVHSQWVRTVKPRSGESAAERRTRARAVGIEHERQGT